MIIFLPATHAVIVSQDLGLTTQINKKMTNFIKSHPQNPTWPGDVLKRINSENIKMRNSSKFEYRKSALANFT